MKTIITSESVNIGHPDKTCDTIADAFLDEALRQDPNAMMAVECAIKNDKLFVYGEATTSAKVPYKQIAQKVLQDIGYTNKFDIICEISEQSKDINEAVNRSSICANDQGIVYGYACTDTAELMPMPIMIAHQLMRQYEQYRRTTDVYFADAKCQVSVQYNNDKPCGIKCILISVSHSPNIQLDKIKQDIFYNVITPVLSRYKRLVKKDCQYIINPSGKFTIWGSFGDSGCVGRKIVVDTYGGVGRVGGGCFSSKNATKVDRSGAYYARYVAKNIVASGLAQKCEVAVSYGIGLDKPITVDINTFGTEKCSLDNIYKVVAKNFDFSPANIIAELDLLRPIYKAAACYGHFGREEFSWEKIKDLKM